MGRIVVSALIGYLVIFVFVFGSFSIAYLAMDGSGVSPEYV